MMLLLLAIILMGSSRSYFFPSLSIKNNVLELYIVAIKEYTHTVIYTFFVISSNLTERMERGEKERKENDRTKSQHSTRQHNKQYVAFASDELLLYKTMQKVTNKDLILILYVLPNHHLIMAGIIWAINKHTHDEESCCPISQEKE